LTREFAGVFEGFIYRPVKQAVSQRLDADVLAWLKKDGEGIRRGRTGFCRGGCLRIWGWSRHPCRQCFIIVGP
jgi:hypothetical protein